MKEFKLLEVVIKEKEEKIKFKSLIKSKKGIKKFDYKNKDKINITFNPNLISEQSIIEILVDEEIEFSIIKNKEVNPTNTIKLDNNALFLLLSGILTSLAFITIFLKFPAKSSNILFIIAILFGMYYPTKSSFLALKSSNFSIKLIMIVGVLGAVYLGLLDEAALLVFIYSLGEVLEKYTTDKARNTLKDLKKELPKEGLVRKNNTEKLIPIREIEINDIVIIKPGEKIPIDGIIKEGKSFVNESSITGESMFVEKKEGDVIYAGTINQNGFLEAMATKRANETTFSKIIQSVEELKSKKSSQERFVQEFENYFTPAMLVLGILVAFSPFIIGGSFYLSIYKGLILFVVSCSCGLALSIPIAIVSATINGSRNGVLFKGGSYLELANSLKIIAFDKTGTLTLGKPVLSNIIKASNISEMEFWTLLKSIESRSSHPIANTIINNLSAKNIEKQQIRSFQSINGLGIKAVMENEHYFIGNKNFYSNRKDLLKPFQIMINNLESEGKTVIILGNKDKILGILALVDKLRPESTNCIKELKELGINVAMLTGDNDKTAKLIASQLNISNYYAELLPEMKVEKIKYLKEKYGAIAMVGDGINDSPAMVMSDIGIAMGAAGSDTAIENGDIVLLSDNLNKLPFALKLSRRTFNNIRENIFFSLATIVMLIALTLTGWIDLVPGFILNEISALFVCGNALRLMK